MDDAGLPAWKMKMDGLDGCVAGSIDHRKVSDDDEKEI